MKIVFTICSNNYLAQALTLGNTLLAFNPDFIFKIGLVDKKSNSIDYDNIPFDIVEAENIGIDGWSKMFLRYNIQELNTAVKPFFFNYFIDSNIQCEQIIYLDPDIQVYSPFSDLTNEFKESDIVITPHITNPIDDDKIPAENDFLNTGLYNLGFLGIKNTENSRRMLLWWSKRLIAKGFNDVKNGLFTDQLWINFAPLFFDRVKVFKHPGYNVAYWNLCERVINKSDSTFFVNNNYPLVFFHFSGFSPALNDQISRYQNRFNFEERKDLLQLFQGYSELLGINNYRYYQSFKCFYSEFKEQYDDKRALEMVKQIPIYKRGIKKVINYITKKYNILLDYHIFYERENLEEI